MASKESLERADRFGYAWDLPGKIRRDLATEFDAVALAAGNEALEKAARVCEEDSGQPFTWEDCAAAIRAMKTGGSK